ncbi:MAG: MBL fold metallo-hydrolase [Clostridia bacterium]|nr:MBL fold metallo-hydrolase [Clostridia bacterium]
MKLVTLIENTTCRDDLICEHGLSLYLETGGHRILFDAGQTDAFADNATRLGIDLAQVDLCILSHGHYDHGGGLARFLRENKHAPVYLSRHAFDPHFNGTEKYIGLDNALMDSKRLVFTDDDHIIDNHLSLHTCNHCSCPYPLNPFGLTMRQDGRHVPEDFRHEQYLLIHEGKLRILISGCSHKGVLNICQWFQPDVLIGGFHMMKLDPSGSGAADLQLAAEALMQYPTQYYTGHCTGEAQFIFLKHIMGDRLQALSTGRCIQL